LRTAHLARPSRWVTISGCILGLLLFVRLMQVLPCCKPTPLDEVLRGHACAAGLDPCPHYDDCAPR
jgi:hypothetical protein